MYDQSMLCLALCVEGMLKDGDIPGKACSEGLSNSRGASISFDAEFHSEIFCYLIYTLKSVVHAGALEQAMQEAESQGVLSSSDELHIGSRSSSSKYRRSEGRPAKGIAKNKAKGNVQSNRRQESLPQVTACDVTKTGRCWVLVAVTASFGIFSKFWGGELVYINAQEHDIIWEGQGCWLLLFLAAHD